MSRVHINKIAMIQMVERNTKTAFNKIGAGLVEKVRSSMSAGSGKTYKRKGELPHVASSPGRPPAPWSGRLHDSITFRTSFGQKSSMGGRAKPGDEINEPKGAMGGYALSVGSNVPYALSMEKGQKRNKVAARPYLWPCLVGSRGLIKEAFTFPYFM